MVLFFSWKGGVYCSGNMPVLTNCTIKGSTAGFGGGVAGTTMYFCEISGNTADLFGGGGERVVAYSCRIFNNTSAEDGGGLDASIAYNTLICSNTVLTADGYGGGGTAFDCTLVNCTVVNNYSFGEGGGVEGGVVINSIVYGNGAAESGPNFNGSVVFSNSCCPDITHGVDGNITASPAFVDESFPNYRLLGTSPCINAGINASAVGAYDLDGNARIIGGVVDMGAYEFEASGSDSDGDGLPDIWEILYFGDLDELPGGFSDLDDFSNLEEYIAGTDPADSASFFAITNWSTGSLVIEWPAYSNRQYRVYRAESLTNTFNQVGDPIYFPQNSYTDLVLNASGFYKVDVQLQ